MLYVVSIYDQCQNYAWVEVMEGEPKCDICYEYWDVMPLEEFVKADAKTQRKVAGANVKAILQDYRNGKFE